jgi:hypothetical protein
MEQDQFIAPRALENCCFLSARPPRGQENCRVYQFARLREIVFSVRLFLIRAQSGFKLCKSTLDPHLMG